jgi:hypothetical protein
MAYVPSFPPDSEEELLKWLQQELEAIGKEFALQDFINLAELTTPPKKLRTGLTVLADGTSWNPGAGQGVYTYYAGSWKKLG